VHSFVVLPLSRPALPRLALSPQAPPCSPSLPGAVRASPLSHASIPCAARAGQCASRTQQPHGILPATKKPEPLLVAHTFPLAPFHLTGTSGANPSSSSFIINGETESSSSSGHPSRTWPLLPSVPPSLSLYLSRALHL
jgi:hypothetical protein